jgi:hypothetical protein
MNQSTKLSINELAAKYQVSPGAIEELIRALRAGGGQAQFNHPDLGGMGQWGGGNMIMIGDMFNHGLKDRVAKLCETISGHLEDFSESVGNRGAGRHPYAFEEANELSTNWWPSRLGRPSSTGSQNNMRYACFPQIHRLAIERDSKLTVYDTGNHRLSGFSQQQSTTQALSFTSQDGTVRLEDLRIEKTSS